MISIKQIYCKIKGYFNPSTLYSSQWLMIMSCNIFGLIPFQFDTTDGKEHFKCSLFGIFAAASHITLFGVCLSLTLYHNEHFVSAFFETDISQVTSIIQLSISFVALAIIYPNFYIKKLKLLKVFDILSKVDGKFMWTENIAEYKRTFYYSVKWIVSNLIICGIYISGSYVIQINLDRPAQLSAWASFFLPHFVLSFVILKFLCIMRQLQNRFRSLNKVIFFFLPKRPRKS